MSKNYSGLFTVGYSAAPTPQKVEWCAPAKQAPSILRYDFDWDALRTGVPNVIGLPELDFSLNVDLTNYRGALGGVKGCQIDNSGCPFRIAIIAEDTLHSVICEPDTIGFFPILTNDFKFRVSRIRPVSKIWQAPEFFDRPLNDFAFTQILFTNTAVPAEANLSNKGKNEFVYSSVFDFGTANNILSAAIKWQSGASGSTIPAKVYVNGINDFRTLFELQGADGVNLRFTIKDLTLDVVHCFCVAPFAPDDLALVRRKVQLYLAFQKTVTTFVGGPLVPGVMTSPFFTTPHTTNNRRIPYVQRVIDIQNLNMEAEFPFNIIYTSNESTQNRFRLYMKFTGSFSK